MEDAINSHEVFVGKPEGKKPLGRPRHRCEDNVKTDLKDIGCEVVDLIHVVQDRIHWRAIVNTVMKLRVP
jgi:hypothetical protein